MDGGTIFFIVWLIVAAFILIKFFLSGKEALSIFPNINTVKVVYRDKSASGNSTQNWHTRIGGAHNSLDIVVTDKEFWLKSMLLFAGIGKRSDLLHKVPLHNIVGINKEGKRVIVDFKTEDGKDKQVILLTKKPDNFIKAIRKEHVKSNGY